MEARRGIIIAIAFAADRHRSSRAPTLCDAAGDAARAARVASLWAARIARSRDWCASQARRYKSVAELKDKGDAAFLSEKAKEAASSATGPPPTGGSFASLSTPRRPGATGIAA